MHLFLWVYIFCWNVKSALNNIVWRVFWMFTVASENTTSFWLLYTLFRLLVMLVDLSSAPSQHSFLICPCEAEVYMSGRRLVLQDPTSSLGTECRSSCSSLVCSSTRDWDIFIMWNIDQNWLLFSKITFNSVNYKGSTTMVNREHLVT